MDQGNQDLNSQGLIPVSADVLLAMIAVCTAATRVRNMTSADLAIERVLMVELSKAVNNLEKHAHHMVKLANQLDPRADTP